MTLALGEIIAKGKTKVFWENLEDPQTEIGGFKDDITAGDGLKKDVIPGKALIDWATNRDIMDFLKRHGVAMAYMESLDPGFFKVRKLSKILKLEVVARRIATGSIKDRGVAEGTVFNPPMIEIFYKDDFLHDPKLDDSFIAYLTEKKKGFDLFSRLKEMKLRQFLLLEAAFACFKCQYMDDKTEYGVILPNGEWDDKAELILVDEITAGSFRLWPWADGVTGIDYSVLEDAMPLLNKAGQLDKQVYRDGGDLQTVKSKFEQIAAITEKFKGIHIANL